MEKLTLRQKLARKHIIVALAFAAAMLGISYVLKGSEQANTVLMVLIALYFAVSNSLPKCNQAKQ